MHLTRFAVFFLVVLAACEGAVQAPLPDEDVSILDENDIVSDATSADPFALSTQALGAQRNNLLLSMTDSITVRKETGIGCRGGQSNDLVTSPTRAGTAAVRHSVRGCAERAELSFDRLAPKQRYVYGWSYYFPPDFTVANDKPGQGFLILMQMAGWPGVDGRNLRCGGVGYKLSIGASDQLSFTFQWQKRPGQFNETMDESDCRKYTDLLDMKSVRGKWVDFVMEVKHTDQSDGYLHLWLKVQGQNWRQLVKVDNAPTWWNSNRTNPYFKAGIYTGDPNKANRVMDPLVLYTDEFRVGNASAKLSDVSPDGTDPLGGPNPMPPPIPVTNAPLGKTITVTAQSNSKLVAAFPSRALQAEGQTVGNEDLYDVIDRGSGLVALRARGTGKLVGVDAQGALFATFDVDAANTRFEWLTGSGNTFSLRSVSNQLLVAAFDGVPLQAEGKTLGTEDRFTFSVR
jgi:hypothetical protein